MTYKALNPILLKMHTHKYLDYKFSNDQNQLKDKSEFTKRILRKENFDIHSKLKIIFHINTQFL